MSTNVVVEAAVIDNSISRPENLYQLWVQYQLHLQSTYPVSKARAEIRLIQTALLRYTVPGWGGPTPLGDRLSPHEITAGLKFTESIELVQFQGAIATLQLVIQQMEQKYREQHPDSKKDWKKYFQELLKRNKHYLSKIWNWANEQGWFDSPAGLKPQVKPYRFYRRIEGKVSLRSLRLTTRRRVSGKTVSLGKPINGQGQRDTFALGKISGDVIHEALQAQLDDFCTFVMDGRMAGQQLREVTAQSHLQHVLRILGWFYRVENMSLENLQLETLVPFIKTSCGSEESFDSFEQESVQALLTRKQAKQIANQVEEKARKYLGWLDSRIPENSKLHPVSKQHVIRTWITVAKYIYRFETDRDESNNFDDILVVRRLRNLNKELNKQSKNLPNVISHDVKMVPWISLLDAVENLRVEAELNYRPSCGKKRTSLAQAKSTQRFLLSSFMTIMPPDRQRTYRELAVGKTLVKGQLAGTFTPSEQMSDPKNAKWYIHLEAPDYKTGDTYGSWWGEVPNVSYPDGKTFYDYIDEWLMQWRQVFAPQHQYFFTKPNGQPMNAHSITQLVKCALYRLLDVPVTPHVLRNMFITYLYELGVPAQVLASAALAMHHSQRMQEKDYNKQQQFDKLGPSFSFTLNLVEQAIGAKS